MMVGMAAWALEWIPQELEPKAERAKRGQQWERNCFSNGQEINEKSVTVLVEKYPQLQVEEERG